MASRKKKLTKKASRKKAVTKKKRGKKAARKKGTTKKTRGKKAARKKAARKKAARKTSARRGPSKKIGKGSARGKTDRKKSARPTAGKKSASRPQAISDQGTTSDSDLRHLVPSPRPLGVCRDDSAAAIGCPRRVHSRARLIRPDLPKPARTSCRDRTDTCAGFDAHAAVPTGATSCRPSHPFRPCRACRRPSSSPASRPPGPRS